MADSGPAVTGTTLAEEEEAPATAATDTTPAEEGEAAASPSSSSKEDSDTRFSVWDETPLHIWKWMPTSNIKAIVYVSHGVGEYMGRYEKLCQELADNGILAFGHDHVGHGKSGGDRVHINTFDTYVWDVINHVKDSKAAHPDLPCFLMGHSMGGLVAALAAIEDQDLFTGVILSGAALEVVAGPVIQFFAKVLGFLIPQLGLLPVDPNLISSIPEEVDLYKEDPLVYHSSLKAKWSSEFIKAVKIGREKISEISVPVFLFHGTDDNLVPFSASEYILNNVASTDKKFEPFEENFHEVLHDKGQERARESVRDWIQSHCEN